MNCVGLANFVTRCRYQLLFKRNLIDSIGLPDKRTILPDDITLSSTDEQDTYIVNTPINTNSIFVQKEDNIFAIHKTPQTQITNTTKLYKVHDQLDTPIMDIYDEFQLSNGLIENYHGEPIITTYGRFILNYWILAFPLGNHIPYINSLFNIKKIQSQVYELILNKVIDGNTYRQFVNNVFFIGSMTELSVPCMTKKSLTTSKEVITRRDELFAKYKDQLDDPIIVAKIEDELIALDKAYLSDDPASAWILDPGDWSTARKKLYITSGLTESFSDNSNEFTMIKEALNEKMDFNVFPAICNDIRRGSYMRGKETAKGGEETKFVLRIFQNVNITEDDCGSKDGIRIKLTFNDLKSYGGRHVYLDGKEIIIDQSNIGDLIGKEVLLRSPMYCKAKTGFCYACYGERYKKLGLKSVGMRVVAASSQLMQTAMKAMHKSKVSTIQIDDLDNYVI